MNKRETAERHSREAMTQDDVRRYRGIARHPLGRRWLLQKLVDAERRAERATDDTTAQRWRLEVERLNRELARLGVDLEGAT